MCQDDFELMVFNDIDMLQDEISLFICRNGLITNRRKVNESFILFYISFFVLQSIFSLLQTQYQ